MIAAVLAGLVLAAPATEVQARPMLLIHQERVVEFTERDDNMDVMRWLSSEMDDMGKVIPIVWSRDQALIATALRTGDLATFTNNPSRDDVFRAARILRAEYVAICKVRRLGADLEGEIEVYRNRGGRPIWDGKTTVSIIRDGRADVESGAMSIASTWAAQMHTVPFKDLAAAPRVPTPDPDNPAIVPAPHLQPDREPMENGRKLLSEGKVVEAIALLRDAVDIAPMNPEARMALIEALRLGSHPFLAAEEAARAAELMPDRAELQLAAAESWIQGGQAELAFDRIQGVLEKEPGNAPAIALLGDLYVGRLDYQRAVEQYSKSVGIARDPEVYFRRAQAYALLEEFADSLKDIDQAKALGLSQEREIALARYRNGVRVVDSVFDSLATSVRNMLREARTVSNPESVRGRAVALANRVGAFMEYIDRIDPPEAHSRSHDHRALSANLLFQAAMRIENFITEDNRSASGDAELLQIESMREYAAAKTRYQQEIGTPRS